MLTRFLFSILQQKKLKIKGNRGLLNLFMIADSITFDNQHIYLILRLTLPDVVVKEGCVIITILKPINFCLLLDEG